MDGTISYVKKENYREKERYVWLLTFENTKDASMGNLSFN